MILIYFSYLKITSNSDMLGKQCTNQIGTLYLKVKLCMVCHANIIILNITKQENETVPGFELPGTQCTYSWVTHLWTDGYKVSADC